MKKYKKFLIYILIVIFALVVTYFSYAWGKKTWPFGEPKYQVVQLISGDIYYGKLRNFPCCKISEAYIINATQSQKEGEEPITPQLIPFSSLFFSPENAIHFSKNQILWWADLSKDSQILKAIKEIKNN